MLRNNIDETYLKGFVPELTKYLWNGETDFSKQKQSAEQMVYLDLSNRGYDTASISPGLVLRDDTDTLSANSTGDSVEDVANRGRCCYNVTVRTGTTSLVLQGSNDEETWTTIATQSITATVSSSFLFLGGFKYYRINSTVTGTLAFTCWLAETIYDALFTYKWLELIMLDSYTEENDQYYKRMEYFRNEYNRLLDSGKLQKDDDFDGTEETAKTNVIDRVN